FHVLLMERVRVESSRTSDAHRLRVEVAVTADVIDESAIGHFARGLDGSRHGDGAEGAPFDPQPRPKYQIAADQRDHQPAHDTARRIVASRDRLQRAAENEADGKIRA